MYVKNIIVDFLVFENLVFVECNKLNVIKLGLNNFGYEKLSIYKYLEEYN